MPKKDCPCISTTKACTFSFTTYQHSALVITQEGGLEGRSPCKKRALFAPFGRRSRPNGAKKGILRGLRPPQPPSGILLRNYVR